MPYRNLGYGVYGVQSGYLVECPAAWLQPGLGESSGLPLAEKLSRYKRVTCGPRNSVVQQVTSLEDGRLRRAAEEACGPCRSGVECCTMYIGVPTLSVRSRTCGERVRRRLCLQRLPTPCPENPGRIQTSFSIAPARFVPWCCLLTFQSCYYSHLLPPLFHLASHRSSASGLACNMATCNRTYYVHTHSTAQHT